MSANDDGKKPWKDRFREATRNAQAHIASKADRWPERLEVLSDLMNDTREEASKFSHSVGNKVQAKVRGVGSKANPLWSTVKTRSQGLAQRFSSKEAVVEVLPDLSLVSEEQRLAYYGAMIAMANADGSLDREELILLLDIFEADDNSKEVTAQLKGFLIDPPRLVDCLAALRNQEETLRFGLAFQLVEVAYADDIIQPEEMSALNQAAEILSVTQPQLEAIVRFVEEARRLEARGQNDKVATECLKQAASGLASVGVPISAVYFSGSVIGLSAAGITSGLAALGLGFGMVPGIAAAVILGTGTYFGLGRVLDLGGHRKKALESAENERRAQLVIRHLQAAMEELLERIEELRESADTARQNERDLLVLKARMKTLQSVIARKKMALTSEC